MTGRTSLEAAQADEIVDAVTDIVNVRVGAVFEPDEGKKAEKMQAYMSQTLPTGMVMIYIFKFDLLAAFEIDSQIKPCTSGPYGKVTG